MNVAALVSGGVDSSVVVYRLKEQGITPTIFYIRIGMDSEQGYMDCSAEEDIEITTYIARKYGCPLEIVSLHQEYWDNVVTYTIEAVKQGLTPNPDIMCNKMIKFGVFEQKYGFHFDKIATGHYATTTAINDKIYLSTAKDHHKDQTYFLGQLDFMQVSRLLFPIGDLLKSEVRTIAAAEQMPCATRKDSQGICFLGKINYNDFIRRYLGEKEGLIVDHETGKIIGKHKGFWFHTIGQRRGLGLSGGPWFCVDKDIDNNIIYASCGYDPQTQYGKTIALQPPLHFITDNPWNEPVDNITIAFKIRHTPEFTMGTLSKQDNRYIIESSEKIQGIAPGQFGVIYDKDCKLCLASGMIALSIV
ncbi:tRNA-specific 2-thiouridylase MnmA 1 [Bacteroidia bacterium]|nr:tRNA-specific 2-thiouridylase MnmA 1 [Bacteroidia bacterium]